MDHQPNQVQLINHNHIEVSRNLNKDEHNRIISFLKENYPRLSGVDYSMYIRCIKDAMVSGKESRIYSKYKAWLETKNG